MLAVSILAMRFDILPVMITAVFSALIWNFFFIPPLTTIVTTNEKNLLGISRKVNKVQEVGNSKTMLKENDIMVLYGRMKDIRSFLNED